MPGDIAGLVKNTHAERVNIFSDRIARVCLRLNTSCRREDITRSCYATLIQVLSRQRGTLYVNSTLDGASVTNLSTA